MSSQPGCVSERGTRLRAHNRCLLTQAVCESRPAAVRLGFTGSVTPMRASSSAVKVARKRHVQALGLFELIRVQIAIYRPRRCFTPKRAQTLFHTECAAGPVESERCRALEHVEATKFLVAKELSSASISKERRTVMCFHRPIPALGSVST